MTSVVVSNLCRHFGAYKALDDISFAVEDGEFLTLLGPSGCGKSTTLTALAGLDRPTSGSIWINGQIMFDSSEGTFIDAQFRNLGLMFQSYALWPHMTVYKNLDFALELRKVRGQSAKKQIEEALEMVDMLAFIDRYPGELSGGQQQRVALARTLVYRPQLLLLDEPLSNLDAKLREKARVWLRDLQRKTGVTTIYVTHDQEEALSLSDRIIVMNKGRIVQADTPRNIYEQPADQFVADFVGASNLLNVTVRIDDRGEAKAIIDTDTALSLPPTLKGLLEGPAVLSIRPENIRLDSKPSAENAVRYTLRNTSYLGAREQVVVKVGDEELRVDTRGGAPKENGLLSIPGEAIRVFPGSTP
ncbi:iron(III) transport system ATP-binding protein [Xaviernesmea oryzae]|uniref:Iron(III) transport system ATP-binding protein n=1 Tax=Xaviernesmea oryzae TaxID=464029 RepID=A0A1X7FQI6_9HYPH|nr:ABC transporter ATP-binding protein [Xaviernesmea oryzae]SMF56756.1 iron(III) transport system ATP-binding protein [Xaviernesmea oryzae]